MKLLLRPLLPLLLLFPTVAGATDFELTDGSVVRGRILSYDKGVYRVQTKSLGTVKLPDAKIRLIRLREGDEATPMRRSDSAHHAPSAGAAASPSPSSVAGEAGRMQERMLADPQVMEIVRQLGDDPTMQKILSDEAVLEGLKNGDPSPLLSHPDFGKVLENPKVKEIERRMQR